MAGTGRDVDENNQGSLGSSKFPTRSSPRYRRIEALDLVLRIKRAAEDSQQLSDSKHRHVVGMKEILELGARKMRALHESAPDRQPEEILALDARKMRALHGRFG